MPPRSKESGTTIMVLRSSRFGCRHGLFIHERAGGVMFFGNRICSPPFGGPSGKGRMQSAKCRKAEQRHPKPPQKASGTPGKGQFRSCVSCAFSRPDPLRFLNRLCGTPQKWLKIAAFSVPRPACSFSRRVGIPSLSIRVWMVQGLRPNQFRDVLRRLAQGSSLPIDLDVTAASVPRSAR